MIIEASLSPLTLDVISPSWSRPILEVLKKESVVHAVPLRAACLSSAESRREELPFPPSPSLHVYAADKLCGCPEPVEERQTA